MNPLSRQYHQLVGLNQDWVIADFQLDMGVKTIAVPWVEKHSWFTLLFEAFAIDVLQASQSIRSAALLLGIHWSTAQGIMQRA